MKTWKIEVSVVAAILLAVNVITHHLFSIEPIAAIAVLLTFCHAQVADRLAEQEALRVVPQVDCYRRMGYYFVGKEVCWLLYFSMSHAYSALVGVFVFLLYPVWRRLYRKHYPVGRYGQSLIH
jgi:hypothetical protein